MFRCIKLYHLNPKRRRTPLPPLLQKNLGSNEAKFLSYFQPHTHIHAHARAQKPKIQFKYIYYGILLCLFRFKKVQDREITRGLQKYSVWEKQLAESSMYKASIQYPVFSMKEVESSMQNEISNNQQSLCLKAIKLCISATLHLCISASLHLCISAAFPPELF